MTITEKNRRIQEQYTSCHSQEQFVEMFIYLTNKNRGAHVTERTLIKKYQYGGIGELLRRYDPIVYNQITFQ
jgi:hypothetical protein